MTFCRWGTTDDWLGEWDCFGKAPFAHCSKYSTCGETGGDTELNELLGERLNWDGICSCWRFCWGCCWGDSGWDEWPAVDCRKCSSDCDNWFVDSGANNVDWCCNCSTIEGVGDTTSSIDVNSVMDWRCGVWIWGVVDNWECFTGDVPPWDKIFSTLRCKSNIAGSAGVVVDKP